MSYPLQNKHLLYLGIACRVPSGNGQGSNLLSLHKDAEDNGRVAICQDDVTVVYLGHCVSDQHITCEHYLFLHQSTPAWTE